MTKRHPMLAMLVVVGLAATASADGPADYVDVSCLYLRARCSTLHGKLEQVVYNAERLVAAQGIRDKNARTVEKVMRQALTQGMLTDAERAASSAFEILTSMRSVADPEDYARIQHCEEACRSEVAPMIPRAEAALRKARYGGMEQIEPWMTFWGGSPKGLPRTGEAIQTRASPCETIREMKMSIPELGESVQLRGGRGLVTRQSENIRYEIKLCSEGFLNGDDQVDFAYVFLRAAGNSATYYVVVSVTSDRRTSKTVAWPTDAEQVVGVESIEITATRQVSIRLRKLGPDDARCCPSMIETRVYSLSDKGELTQRFVSLTKAQTTSLRSPSSDAAQSAAPPVRERDDMKLEDLFVPGELESILKSEKERQGSRERP